MTGARGAVASRHRLIIQHGLLKAVGLAKLPDAVITARLAQMKAPTVVHGKARGVDEIAAQVAADWGWLIHEFPANWERYGKAAGHVRNAAMVHHPFGVDICLGFPMPGSRGTWDCLQQAADAGVHCEIWPLEKGSDERGDH